MYDLYRPPLLCLADSSEDVPARQLYFYSQEEEKREGDSSVQEYGTSLIRIVISNVGWNIFALPGTVNSAFLATHPLFSHLVITLLLSSLFFVFTYLSPIFLPHSCFGSLIGKLDPLMFLSTWHYFPALYIR